MSRRDDLVPRRPLRGATPLIWQMELRDSLRREQGRASSRRVALYSHDTQGLGHIRRNTLLAAAMVAADPEVDVLLLSGAREAASLPLPERTDLVVLPGLTKDALGGYAARCLDRSLGEVLAIRAAALESLLAAYEPDLLVVDKVPRGFRGELEPALRRARLEHGTRTVLGLRDILDDVSTTRREWQIARTPEAIRTLYDQVWVYADPTVFDPAVEYGWSEAVRTKVRYTGYLGADRERLLPTTKHSSITPSVSRDNAGPFVLGLIGGGQDGAAVADAFAHADFPAGHVGVLVTGPYLPSTHLEHLERLARHRRDLRVHRFVNDVPALARASRATVSMGGYNSVCELMTARRPALVVPRVAPRSEQSIRATHFADRGLLDVLFPQHLDPQALSGWLRAAVSRVAPPSRSIDLGGLGRVPDLVTALLESSVVQGARDVG